jgi:hypothetical protein
VHTDFKMVFDLVTRHARAGFKTVEEGRAKIM